MKKGIEGLCGSAPLQGIVYLLVGALALRLAAGVGGGGSRTRAAHLYVVLRKPYVR